MERDPQTGQIEHRQVVGTVSHGYRLGDIDPFELTEQTQQFGLAAAVDDLARVASREFAVLDLEFVGIDIVETELLAQVVAEIGETARKNRRFVSHPLQDGHHALQPFGDGQVAGDLLHDRHVEPLEQRHALREALAEIDFAAHGALGDGAHTVADARPVGQFVDHFGLDQRRRRLRR